MILEKQTQAVVLQEGEQTQDSIGMSLDLDSAQILMQMLSKNLYSDDIGSTVRECASNALDSHRRAGTTDPIIVSFGANKDGNYEFSVEDFGIGLDAEDVKNIISKYGKSTKRNSANELGMMGLGFKAPLAYCSSFYFVCRKNGVERKYMMYEGEEVNTIDLLYETSTDQKNGVKVIVPVRFYDRSSFISKIKEQLAYFENVYFNVDGVDNDFTIMRHEHFQWSPLSANSNLHICLDNVYYPIDFGKLGIDTIYFPVGLRFSLTDGLFPTPNRESLRYTTEAKAVIMKKLQSVANFFVEKYNETVQDTTDIWAAMEHFRHSDRNLNLFGKNGLNVSYFAKYATIGFASPKVDGVYYQTVEYYNRIRESMFGEYVMKHEVSRGRFCKASSYWDLSRRYGEKIYVYSDRLSGIKKEYLKSVNRRGHTEYIVKKEKSFKLGNAKDALAGYENYYKILQLNKFQKSEWRNVIKEFQEMVRRVTASFINLDTLEVPQEFIDSKKKVSFTNGVAGPKQRRKKLEGELTGKVASALERTVYGQNAKFVPTVFQMKHAHRNKYLLVYGNSTHQTTFDKMFSVFPPNTTRFMVLSERELKRMEEIDLHNWIHIDKFMEGDHIVFKRAATAYLINELTKDYAEVFNRIDKIGDISTELYKKMLMLDSYKRKYHLHGDNSLYQSIIKLAEEKNLFDLSIYSVYNEVKEVFAMLPFIKPMFGMMSRYGSNSNGVNDAVRDLFKYYKQRVDWKHYNIKLNDEVVTPIVDLNVEELS
jgi:hypothetical protein